MGNDATQQTQQTFVTDLYVVYVADLLWTCYGEAGVMNLGLYASAQLKIPAPIEFVPNLLAVSKTNIVSSVVLRLVTAHEILMACDNMYRPTYPALNPQRTTWSIAPRAVRRRFFNAECSSPILVTW